jgi:hypothetical protein
MSNVKEAVIATKAVLNGIEPVVYIDKSGGVFQFLGESEVTEADAVVCKLEDILKADKSLEPIVDKISGNVFAERNDPKSEWLFGELESEDE